MGKYIDLVVVFPYITLVVFTLAIWISSIATICSIDNCSYGTNCHFSTFNDTCFLSVDNRTLQIDRDTAAPDALVACIRNSTIACYYSKSRDSIGQSLGDYYKTKCTDHYFDILSGLIITNSVVLTVIVVFSVIVLVVDCSKK